MTINSVTTSTANPTIQENIKTSAESIAMIASTVTQISNSLKEMTETNLKTAVAKPINAVNHINNTATKNHLERFFEMIRRINNYPENNKESEKKLLALLDAVKPDQIDSIVKVISEGHFDPKNPIFDDPDCRLYALQAFREGKLLTSQFVTFAMFIATRNQQKKESESPMIQIPLFNSDGTPNPDAVKYIKETLKNTNNKNKSFLNDEQLDLFFKRMKSEPKSEQQLFVIDQFHGGWYPIVEGLKELRGFNVFCDFKIDNQKRRMVPSAMMMQQFLHVLKGENAVKMNFVLGYSSKEDIRQNGLHSARDVAVPFDPWVQLPPEADRSLAEGIDFLYHDFYHAFSCSCVPQELRLLAIDAYDFSTHTLKGSTAKLYEKHCVDTMLDMDFEPFQPETIYKAHVFPSNWAKKIKEKDPSAIFMANMRDRFQNAVEASESRISNPDRDFRIYDLADQVIAVMMRVNTHNGGDVTGLSYILEDQYNLYQQLLRSSYNLELEKQKAAQTTTLQTQEKK